MDAGSVITPVLGRGAIAESALFGWQSCDVFFFEGLIVAASEYERVARLVAGSRGVLPRRERRGNGVLRRLQCGGCRPQGRGKDRPPSWVVVRIISDCDAASISRGIGLFTIDVVGGTGIVDELVDFCTGVGIGFRRVSWRVS